MRKFGILCLGRKGWDHDISECCRGLHGGERFGALHEWCEKGTLAGWEWKGHSRSKIQIGTEIKWRETLVSWEKLTTEPFGGGVEGLSSNIGEHEAFCFHKQLSVCETDDNSFEIIQSEENNEKRMENNGKEWGKPMWSMEYHQKNQFLNYWSSRRRGGRKRI